MDVTQFDWLSGAFQPLSHEPPCPPDSRCTVCYTADEIAEAESFDETYDDDKRERPDREDLTEIVNQQTGYVDGYRL